MKDLTMRQMLEAGVHFGHQTRFWNPKMAPYIFGSRNKIHILNLEKTLPLFFSAEKFIFDLASNGGQILFIGSKRAARKIIEEEATRCSMPFVSNRWLGGMLTNFKTIQQSVKRLFELEEIISDENSGDFKKKELLQLSREKEKLEKNLGGIKNMVSLPDAIFVIDVGYESIAIKEAIKLDIPVIAIVDTNCSPDGIDYLIPGNDDAMKSISLYTKQMANVVLEGKKSIPVIPEGEDDFVELDESGKPKKSENVNIKKTKSLKNKITKKKITTKKTTVKKISTKKVSKKKDIDEKKISTKKVSKKKNIGEKKISSKKPTVKKVKKESKDIE